VRKTRDASWSVLLELGAWLLLFAPLPLGAETRRAAEGGSDAAAFVLQGSVADASGPLAGKIVIVSPIDSRSGRGVTRYSIVNGAPGPMMNPKTTTDAQGVFSLTVPRSLFQEPPGCAVNCTAYEAGRLSLGVYDDAGGGSYRSSLQAAIVEFDEQAARVDAGRLVLQPLE
jgi:hypothetical protein